MGGGILTAGGRTDGQARDKQQEGRSVGERPEALLKHQLGVQGWGYVQWEAADRGQWGRGSSLELFDLSWLQHAV